MYQKGLYSYEVMIIIRRLLPDIQVEECQYARSMERGRTPKTEKNILETSKVLTVLRFDFYAEQITHKVFMVEATTRAPHQSAVPLSGQEITFQKLNATVLSIFLAENFQIFNIFSKSNYHQEIPKLNANKKTCCSPGSTTDSKQSAGPHRLALTL